MAEPASALELLLVQAAGVAEDAAYLAASSLPEDHAEALQVVAAIRLAGDDLMRLAEACAIFMRREPP